MNALELVAQRVARPLVGKRNASMAWDEWVSLFSPDGLQFMLNTTFGTDHEQVSTTFAGYVEGLYLRNSVVFACLALRARLFSEARFQFQQMRAGRPGALFGTPALGVLEHPEPGKTTGDLLSAAILDADLAGNAFLLGRSDRIRRLRPDWVTIAYGSKGQSTELGTWDPDAEVIGYGYQPGGLGSGHQLITFGPDEVTHFVSNHHPLAKNLGISLLTSGLRDIMGDNAATAHKLKFFEHNATSNLALKVPPTMSKEKAEEWLELFEQEHTGLRNQYRTITFGGGMEPVQIGSTFQQMTFRELQGMAENRIASLTGMHPVVAALSEGLQGASLNAGNFSSAARQVADGTLRPLWRNMAGSLETIVPPVPGSRLWYDARDVAFLRADTKDEAQTAQVQMSAINSAILSGFDPNSAIDAITANDLTRLKHTGLPSVQLQAPPAQLPAAYRVRSDFWAAEGPLVALGTIAAGTLIPADHLLASEFPSLMEPSADLLPAPPKAVGPLQLVASTDDGIRCSSCGRLWAERVSGSYRFTCSRCKTVNEGATDAVATPALARLEEVQRQQAELLVALAGRSTQMTIAEGAIQVTTPVSVAPPTFESGSINVSTPVTVEPSPVTIAEGAVRVSVEPSPVTISDGAVRVDVHTPPMSIEPGAVQVTVEPSPVTIEAGAIQVAAPDIHVDAPAITVEAAEAPHVEIADGAVRVNVEQPRAATEAVVDAIKSLEERLTRPRVVDKALLREFLPGDSPDKPTGRPIGVRETEL